MRHSAIAIVGLALVAASPPTPAKATSEAPPFEHWIDGTQAGEAQIQVQRIDDDSFVIRQSVLTNFEAPFMYLLFGEDRALLIDSGAGGLQIRPTIDRLIADWRARHSGRRIDLVVAHSHGHGDHHAGDSEFSDRPNTQVVGLRAEEVAAFFGIADWPEGLGRFNLGKREIVVIPTPGHEPAHVMYYDPHTRILFSGDMIYPGRLYYPRNRLETLKASADRLAAFAQNHTIRALLGAHIEMTDSPGQDYAMKAPTHPAEHGHALPPSVIGEVQRAIDTSANPPEIDRHPDFILYPVDPRPAD